MQVVKSTSEKTINAWQTKLSAGWGKSVIGIVELGKMLQQAKKEIPHGDWRRVFEGPHRPFSIRTAQELMAIARHPVIGNAQHVAHLPAAWSSLNLLSELPQKRLLDLIASGEIHPDVQRPEIERILRREDSLARQANLMNLEAEERPYRAKHLSPDAAYLSSSASKAAPHKPDIHETLNELKRLLVDLEHCREELRKNATLRKKLEEVADRILAIAQVDAVPAKAA
jgi:hypothetical protein